MIDDIALAMEAEEASINSFFTEVADNPWFRYIGRANKFSSLWASQTMMKLLGVSTTSRNVFSTFFSAALVDHMTLLS